MKCEMECEIKCEMECEMKSRITCKDNNRVWFASVYLFRAVNLSSSYVMDD